MASNSDDGALKAVQVKLVLLGEAAVGKSSLVMRFCSNDYNENTSPTIGAAFLTQKCRLENRIVKFEIWDTAGQERFHSLAPMYYRNAAAAVVVYDITKAASLEKAKAWVKELQRQANPNIIIALVGNKLDLVSDLPVKPVESSPESESTETPESTTESEEDDDKSDSTPVSTPTASSPNTGSDDPRQVLFADAEAYAKETSLLFFEASAKTGANVSELFTEIAKAIPVDTPQPKTPAGGAGAGRRGAGEAGEGRGGVNLERGEGAKKGGCC